MWRDHDIVMMICYYEVILTTSSCLCTMVYSLSPLGLNTCIGSANYTYFYRTMLLLLIMELSHFVIQLVLLIDSFTGGATNDRVHNWLGGDGGTEELQHAVWIFFLIFNSVAIILLGQLIWFHICLQRKNLTTYQFIVQDSKKKREKMRLEEDLANQRIVAVAKARRENKPLEAMRLQMGGCCRTTGCTLCDPMDLPLPADPEAGFAAALGNTHMDNNNNDTALQSASTEENGEGEERPPSLDNEPEMNFNNEQLANGNA